MKLLRYGPKGSESPAIVDSEGRHRDLSGIIDDIDAELLASSCAVLRGVDIGALPLIDTRARIGPPVATVGKFVCVGLNYRDHAAEAGMAIPAEPVLFLKATSAVCGPFDDIVLPPQATKADWEVELGVVIGPGGKNIAEGDAMRHVWGYTVINDLSWRDIQRRHGGQWHKGKSLDGTCPMGPCIVTADSLDWGALQIACRVNGVTKQEANTRQMFFRLPRLIAELSVGMTLEPGDVISSGTPEGVGYARTPPEFLEPGDLLETEVEGIGVLRNPIG